MDEITQLTDMATFCQSDMLHIARIDQPYNLAYYGALSRLNTVQHSPATKDIIKTALSPVSVEVVRIEREGKALAYVVFSVKQMQMVTANVRCFTRI